MLLFDDDVPPFAARELFVESLEEPPRERLFFRAAIGYRVSCIEPSAPLV